MIRTHKRGWVAVVGVVLAAGCGETADHSGTLGAAGGSQGSSLRGGRPGSCSSPTATPTGGTPSRRACPTPPRSSAVQVELKRNNSQLQGQVEKLREAPGPVRRPGRRRLGLRGRRAGRARRHAGAPEVGQGRHHDRLRRRGRRGRRPRGVHRHEQRQGGRGRRPRGEDAAARRAARSRSSSAPRRPPTPASAGRASSRAPATSSSSARPGRTATIPAGPRRTSRAPSARTPTSACCSASGRTTPRRSPRRSRRTPSSARRSNAVTFDLDEAAVDQIAAGNIDAERLPEPLRDGLPGREAPEGPARRRTRRRSRRSSPTARPATRASA